MPVVPADFADWLKSDDWSNLTAQINNPIQPKYNTVPIAKGMP